MKWCQSHVPLGGMDGGVPGGRRRTLWKALVGKSASATRIQAAMPAWYACAVPLLSTASGRPAADSRMPVTAGHVNTQQ
jgi:hypothetical protein